MALRSRPYCVRAAATVYSVHQAFLCHRYIKKRTIRLNAVDFWITAVARCRTKIPETRRTQQQQQQYRPTNKKYLIKCSTAVHQESKAHLVRQR